MTEPSGVGLPGVELALNPEDEPFFDALDRGEIAVPWCVHCDDHVWPPRSHCVHCYHPVEEWRTLAGTGEIYSFAVVHRGDGVFAKRPAYVFALVTLDDGPTVHANVVADDLADVAVGRRVRLAARPAPAQGRAGAQFVLD
jgi:uncharacterized OB-fold protein